MAADDIKKTVVVEAEYTDNNSLTELTNKLVNYQRELDNASAKQKEADKSTAAGMREWVEYGKQAQAARNQLRETSREIQNTITAQRAQEGSLVQLQRQLSVYTQQYNNLSRAERSSRLGSQLRKDIIAVTEELKNAEEELGNFRRSVGDYENRVKNALVPTNSLISLLITIGRDSQTAAGG